MQNKLVILITYKYELQDYQKETYKKYLEKTLLSAADQDIIQK